MQLSSPLRCILSGQQPFSSNLFEAKKSCSVSVIGLVRVASATLVFSISLLLVPIVPLQAPDTDARWDFLWNLKLSWINAIHCMFLRVADVQEGRGHRQNKSDHVKGQHLSPSYWGQVHTLTALSKFNCWTLHKRYLWSIHTLASKPVG